MSGDTFGDPLQDKLREIRGTKAGVAAFGCDGVKTGPRSVVPEIGSGIEFTSKEVTKRE